MLLSFDDADIRRQVLDFLASLDIQPHDERDIILGGELHRFRVHDDKATHKSGSICIHTDGWPAGFVQDWHKNIKEFWKYDTSGLDIDDEQRKYFNSAEFRKKCEEEHRKAEEARKAKRLERSGFARRLWEKLLPAPINHPYLQRKNVYSYGLRFNQSWHDGQIDILNNCLAVPLCLIDGTLMSIQWIPADPDKNKLFYQGAELKGAFFSIALDTINKNSSKIILLGEGYATMAKLYELTGYPVAAAMSCFRLKEIANILHEAYPNCKLLIMADNDWETQIKRDYNPGIKEAKAVVSSKLAIDFIAPEFSPADTGCSDWDDFAIKYGDEKTKEILQKKIEWACLTEAQRMEVVSRNSLSQFIHNLDPNVQLPPQEFIGGIFPRSFVSLLFAPPGTGKTIFMQKFCSDLSIGGNIFDGFAENEPVRKSLILAGEAGYELLTRRAAYMKWPLNTQNIFVLDQYEAETNNVSVMLNEDEGWLNISRLVDMYKPDILFIDTFSLFHEKDENKAPEIKPIIKKLAVLAKLYNMAIVLVHHSRKRAAKERSLSLDQNDVIGSSILNRLVGLIIGIEPTKDDEKVLLVRTLKSWFSPFMPFSYTLKENLYSGTTVQVDLAPAVVNNSKASVWFYLKQTFELGEWFSFSQIVLSEINGNVSEWQVRRILTDLVKKGRLAKRGATKTLEYSITPN